MNHEPNLMISMTANAALSHSDALSQSPLCVLDLTLGGHLPSPFKICSISFPDVQECSRHLSEGLFLAT